MTPYQRLIQLLKPDNREIGQVYSIALFKGLIALSLPLGIQSIINFIQGGNVSVSWIVLSVLIAVAIAFNGYLHLVQMRVMENIQQKIFARAAFDFTIRLPKIDVFALGKYYPPELMNRFFEVLTIQKALPKIIIDLSTALLQILFGLILLSLYHPFFVLYSLLLVIMIVVIVRYTGKKAMDSSMLESKYKYKVVGWLEEFARARDAFKLSGVSPLPFKNTDQRVSGYLKARETHYTVLRSQYMLLVVYKVLVALSLLIVGGLLVIEQKMNIGQFVAAEIIILLVIDSTEKIIMNLENVYDLFTSMEKLSLVTSLPLDEQVTADKAANLQVEGPLSVELTQMTFSFENSNSVLFKELYFQFQPGKKYCITGAGGNGKSTLLHLVAGQFRPSSGNICINGIPLNNYMLPQLYTRIGNALKEESIFEGTILENVTLGREGITQEMVATALKNVCVLDEVKALPNGWLTQLSPLGKHYASSFLQKLLIARSFVHQPSLILFEQPMDAINNADAEKIVDYLCNNPHWTLIAISKNEWFQKKCDQKLELAEGHLQKIF